MHEIFEKRWSARGLDPAATIPASDVAEILDAARWAPTWGGTQPVRMIVGVRGDEVFDAIAATLAPGNDWALSASALVLMTTRADAEDENAHTYGAVDLGLAAAQLILQATALGYTAHPMAGFESGLAVETFEIPAGHRPLLVVSIGSLADPATLSPKIQARDTKERTRLPLTEVAFGAHWGRPTPLLEP
ncbi:nitroreductase family protein [Williamsia sp. CHRR-6]|uniref:nitroreductase family protein n=1 Tax=Williamsia sp. CHRR-6 TaxID=2835871 RepID=UPI001BDA3F82|nr:nitroreductase family protein [Williamsia sp. CHRR-6]MBT0567209.1 nitroreductase family protein [Williamsia sp. CHRR-6]